VKYCTSELDQLQVLPETGVIRYQNKKLQQANFKTIKSFHLSTTGTLFQIFGPRAANKLS
jgi:hypothetical protein